MFGFLQPIPHRREEQRPVSCFLPGMAALSRDAASLGRAKQRSQVPSMMISNETYGTMMDFSLPSPPPVGLTPPLPPRVPSRGRWSQSPGWWFGVALLLDSQHRLFLAGSSQTPSMETVGRQRSSSDPPNPLTTERNTSVYGKCHFLCGFQLWCARLYWTRLDLTASTPSCPVLPAAPPQGNKRSTMLDPRSARNSALPPPPVPPPPNFKAPTLPPPVPSHQAPRPPGPPGPPELQGPKSPKSPTG